MTAQKLRCLLLALVDSAGEGCRLGARFTFVPSEPQQIERGDDFMTGGFANSVYRMIVSALMILLSIILPVGIVWWSVTSAVPENTFRRSSTESRQYAQGSVRNGELWFPVHIYSSRWRSHRLIETRIKRLNLTTGRISETDLVIENETAHPVWMDDELYVFSKAAIYKMEGTSVKKLALIPESTGFFHVSPFLYDGQLTTIIETFDNRGRFCDDEFRLVHLVDGKWVDGRKILLPGRGRQFKIERTQGRPFARTLLPRSPLPPGGLPLSQLSLSVATREQNVHLFFEGDAGFSAYRSGFEFTDEEDGSASVLAPENSFRDVSGWEPAGAYAIKPEGLALLINDKNDFLVYSKSGRGSVVMLTTDSRRDSLERHANIFIAEDSARGKFSAPFNLLLDDADHCAYLMSTDDVWDSATVRRIEGNEVQPVQLEVPGTEHEYLTRWQRLIPVMPLAWLLHLTLVVVGTDARFRNDNGSTYVFGVRQASLASTKQRALAFLIDAFLISAVGMALISIQPWIFQTKWSQCTKREVCDVLLQLENSLPFEIPSHASEALLLVFGLKQEWALFKLILAVGILTVIALSCLKFYFEGRQGITPGKWLLGIRTVGSTLRPCGFARAMFRDLLYWVEIPLFVTPLPAALRMIFTADRQRIGDRLADTIVIRAVVNLKTSSETRSTEPEQKVPNSRKVYEGLDDQEIDRLDDAIRHRANLTSDVG